MLQKGKMTILDSSPPNYISWEFYDVKDSTHTVYTNDSKFYDVRYSMTGIF